MQGRRGLRSLLIITGGSEDDRSVSVLSVDPSVLVVLIVIALMMVGSMLMIVLCVVQHKKEIEVERVDSFKNRGMSRVGFGDSILLEELDEPIEKSRYYVESMEAPPSYIEDDNSEEPVIFSRMDLGSAVLPSSTILSPQGKYPTLPPRNSKKKNITATFAEESL